jgi:biopolymer transport protein ExbD
MGKTGRKVPGLNSSSTADISFILLIFFLVTTSMDTDTGLARQLPPWDPDAQEDDVKIKERNILLISINKNNEILCRGSEVQVSELTEIAKEFIVNPENKANLPVKENFEIPGFGNVISTANKHVISLSTDRTTGYEIYFKVQNELTRAYDELRDDWCLETFNHHFMDCTEEQQSYAKAMYPSKISEAEPKNYGTNLE